MRTQARIAATVTALVLTGGLALALGQQQQQQQQQQQLSQQARQQDAQAVISQWPDVPRQVAQRTIDTYGQPSGVTPSRLVWNDPQQGPWSEIVVYREEVPHAFPMPHTDVLEQVMYFEVPENKVDELAEYDGSVIVERTKGTLAARCDREEANYLALNLAHDIITGEKTVEEARQAYADAIQQFKQGPTPQIMQELTFEPMPKDEAQDADVAVIEG